MIYGCALLILLMPRDLTLPHLFFPPFSPNLVGHLRTFGVSAAGVLPNGLLPRVLLLPSELPPSVAHLALVPCTLCLEETGQQMTRFPTPPGSTLFQGTACPTHPTPSASCHLLGLFQPLSLTQSILSEMWKFRKRHLSKWYCSQVCPGQSAQCQCIGTDGHPGKEHLLPALASFHKAPPQLDLHLPACSVQLLLMVSGCRRV